MGRILALQRHHLTTSERGKLEVALHPLITRLLDEPKTFIHFEFTPGNLQMVDERIIAMDFEQSTLGPAAFDLATLLYGPEADLTDDEMQRLLDFYHELLPAAAPASFRVSLDTLETAAIMKLLFYAGSAANFYRKFEEDDRLAGHGLVPGHRRTPDAALSSLPGTHRHAAPLLGWTTSFARVGERAPDSERSSRGADMRLLLLCCLHSAVFTRLGGYARARYGTARVILYEPGDDRDGYHAV